MRFGQPGLHYIAHMVIGLSDTIYQLFYLSEYVMSLYGLGQGARSSRKPGELDFFRAAENFSSSPFGRAHLIPYF